MPDLSGRRVLITGGARRLGATLCRAFAARGAAVVIHCLKSKEEAAELCASLPPCSAPLRHEVVNCDLSDANAPRILTETVGAVDFLVNNAAIWIRGGASESELARQNAVNALTPAALIQAFAAIAPADAEFSAVNILDAAVLPPARPVSPYECSKAELMAATRRLAFILAPRARVNAAALGPVFPPRELGANGMKHIPGTLPLKRPVCPADAAEAVVFLASNHSITGAVLPVDCGQSLPKQ